jgi:hypothetical protein
MYAQSPAYCFRISSGELFKVIFLPVWKLVESTTYPGIRLGMLIGAMNSATAGTGIPPMASMHIIQNGRM